MAFAAFSAAIASLKNAKDIAEAMIGLRDTASFQEKRLELQSKIVDAQGSVFAVNEERLTLLDRVRQLEEQLANIEDWDTEKQRYHLKEVAPGAFSFVLKKNASLGEPPHWICSACYQRRRKTLLQAGGQGAVSGLDSRKTIWDCVTCKAQVRVPTGMRPVFIEDEANGG